MPEPRDNTSARDLAQRLSAALASRYRIERPLGRGGMATVFLAEDLKHGRRVAIKVMEPEVAAAIGPQRFLREIETAARLTHPHILPLHDSGEADGLLYYVTPYVAGESLRKRLEREKQLSVEEALRIAREAAEALDYAHRQGVVHRDIKPENVLIEEGHALVADFGIARVVTPASADTQQATLGVGALTTAGVTVGTPQYMSPEQISGSRDVDGRSDQYSLGCVVYELLAGQAPFTGPTVQSLAHQHISVTPRPVTELRPTVPAPLAAALAKAMAKVPADRFATAAEFAAALVAGPPLVAAERPRWRRTRIAIAALLGVTIAGATLGLPWLAKILRGTQPAPSSQRDWVLVAEFDAPADDPGLASAARELVAAGFDQSRFVASVPREQLREALRLAGRPDTTRVDAAVAHEIAYRGSVRAVVEGRIDRVGSGYSVVLKVSDVEKGAVLLSVSDAARTQDDLIPTFGRLVRRLLDGLWERRGDVKATREPIVAATPSFEAYRKLVRARHLQTVDSDDRGSIALCREALAIDPDFAAAWMLMGWGFDHLGQTDSLQWAFGEALRRPERLSEEERLFLESTLASYLNERAVSLALHDRLVRDYPSPSAYGNRGALLGELGRFEEALQDQELAVRIEAFVPRQWILYNQFVVLIVLGRLAEAEQVAARLKGTSSALAPLALATAGNQWARAESCATALLADPAVDPEVRAVAALAAASEEAARGRLAASRRFLNQARRAADEVGSEALRRDASRAALLLGVASGGEIGPPDRELARDTSLAALVVQGCWSAAAGDVSGARRLLDRVQRYSAQARARLGAGPELLEAWIAGGSGRWEDAAQILGPAARQSFELGFVTDGVGPMPMRWLMAEAWERLAQSDSAAAYFELALTPERVLWEQRLPMRMVSTFAHRRLVLLYARAGRLEEARRHWKAIEETARTPDPEVERSMDEARLALARAEDAAKSARR